MSFTPEELEEFLYQKAQEEWDKKSQPFFLAWVQPELEKISKDYKDAIPNQRLNEFVEGAVSLKLVRHPTQFAKVGVIPSDKEFSFPISKKQADLPNSSSSKMPLSESALVSFVEAISKMPREELVDFKVPATLLVALLNRK